ncbi:aminoglycoside N(3)-acetyltransferase [Cryptosporangium sp. NPDC048952]|uniref:aminoglycoside N(3)-acetyltransferase n=1 Tax=Cryptosporangium sp. NPDC048952 TaxID=3363961 RepID=UPI0037222566
MALACTVRRDGTMTPVIVPLNYATSPAASPDPTHRPGPVEREAAVVGRTPEPRTRRTLAADLGALGVQPGDVLLVHTSLSALGWVAGREQAVILALQDAVGPTGTLVVPTQTGSNSDPAEWQAPAVPAEWWDSIRDGMPAFDPARTPSDGMGALPEALRSWPGAIRSGHPQTSFAGLGPAASGLLRRHDLDCRFGDRSPLSALAAAGARVLLLGAGYDACTAFHLGEARSVGAPRERLSCAALDSDGQRRWVRYVDVVADERDFAVLGEAFEATGAVAVGLVGSADARLFDLDDAARFAASWIPAHRAGWSGPV